MFVRASSHDGGWRETDRDNVLSESRAELHRNLITWRHYERDSEELLFIFFDSLVKCNFKSIFLLHTHDLPLPPRVSVHSFCLNFMILHALFQVRGGRPRGVVAQRAPVPGQRPQARQRVQTGVRHPGAFGLRPLLDRPRRTLFTALWVRYLAY